MTKKIIDFEKRKNRSIEELGFIDYFPDDENQMKRISLKIGVPLLNELKRRADIEFRTVSGEIILRLIASIEDEDAIFKKKH